MTHDNKARDEPKTELPDLDDLRSEVRDHIEEVWGVDTCSQVEAAMLEQETDWVLSLIDKAKIEAREEQIMQDELSLSNDQHFDDIDESLIISWREDQLARLKSDKAEQ